MADRAAAKAPHNSSHHPSKPAAQAHGPPQTRPEQRQGPPVVCPPPYQTPMSAHIQQMPYYRHHRGSQPNPETESVRAYPRVHVHPRPRFSRTPTAQDYEDSHGPTIATSPHDLNTHTHAHTSAQGHGPARGQWWQRWTHTQLWELRKWAWAETSLEGLVRRPRKGRWRTSASSRRGIECHRPHGKPCWPMRFFPRESTSATSRHPRTTSMSSDARRRPSRRREEREGACGTSPEAQPHAQTPPCHPASVDARTLAAPTAPREPRAPHSTTLQTPRPAAPPPNPKGGYSLGRAQAPCRRGSLPTQHPAHPPQPRRQQRTRPPAEPPRGRPSPSPPTVTHRYTPSNQPPPQNITSRRSQAQRKPMDANARTSWHRYAQRRQTQARNRRNRLTRHSRPAPAGA